MNGFDEAHAKLIGVEKGYSDNPNDPGNWSSGKVDVGTLEGTMYGISAPVARANGYTGLMKFLSLEVAKAIAKRQYWDKYQCDQFDARIGYQVFDTAYNGGHPAQWLQMAVGAKADGVIGAETVAAVRAANVYQVIALFNASRLDYMADCPGKEFDDGWMHRIAECLRIGAT